MGCELRCGSRRGVPFSTPLLSGGTERGSERGSEWGGESPGLRRAWRLGQPIVELQRAADVAGAGRGGQASPLGGVGAVGDAQSGAFPRGGPQRLRAAGYRRGQARTGLSLLPSSGIMGMPPCAPNCAARQDQPQHPPASNPAGSRERSAPAGTARASAARTSPASTAPLQDDARTAH